MRRNSLPHLLPGPYYYLTKVAYISERVLLRQRMCHGLKDRKVG